MSKLPTVYFGQRDGDTDAIDAALEDFIERMNQVPPHLARRVLSSLVVTACLAQPDPIAAFEGVVVLASDAIDAFLAKPEGNA
jgi:hypothetical protein